MKKIIIVALEAMALTSARHDILNKFYAENFKESYDNSLSR